MSHDLAGTRWAVRGSHAPFPRPTGTTVGHVNLMRAWGWRASPSFESPAGSRREAFGSIVQCPATA